MPLRPTRKSPHPTTPGDHFEARVRHLIGRIPAGQVATYGQIAALAGHPRRARHVGQVLAGSADTPPLPWHRVINAQGRISSRSHEGAHPGESGESRQERRLAAEGVVLKNGRIDLKQYQWHPEEDAAPLFFPA